MLVFKLFNPIVYKIYLSNTVRIKPSKLKKVNKSRRRLISLNKLWTLQVILKKNRLVYVRALKTLVEVNYGFKLGKIFLLMRQVRLFLRRLYGNVTEGRLRKFHKWVWKKKKKKIHNKPHNYFDIVDRRLLMLLLRTHLYRIPNGARFLSQALLHSSLKLILIGTKVWNSRHDIAVNLNDIVQIPITIGRRLFSKNVLYRQQRVLNSLIFFFLFKNFFFYLKIFLSLSKVLFLVHPLKMIFFNWDNFLFLLLIL